MCPAMTFEKLQLAHKPRGHLGGVCGVVSCHACLEPSLPPTVSGACCVTPVAFSEVRVPEHFEEKESLQEFCCWIRENRCAGGDFLGGLAEQLGGDRCGSRLGPAKPPAKQTKGNLGVAGGLAGSLTRPAISAGILVDAAGAVEAFGSAADKLECLASPMSNTQLECEAGPIPVGGATSVLCQAVVGRNTIEQGHVAGMELSMGSATAGGIQTMLAERDSDIPTSTGLKGCQARGVPTDQSHVVDMESSIVSAKAADAKGDPWCGPGGGCSAFLHDEAESVQSQLQEHLGKSTKTSDALPQAEVQAFLDWCCKADFAQFMSPERAAAALEVQRVLREGQGCEGDAVSEVSTSGGSTGSCSGRSSSVSSSERLFPPQGFDGGASLAGLLTEVDGAAFVAKAQQSLPGDWLQRTHRQQKRFVSSLRRSHFGGKGRGPAVLGGSG